MMGKISSPLCVTCGRVEDIIHFLVECDANKELRKRHIKFPLNSQDINILLSDPNSEKAKEIFRFVKILCKNK